MLVQKGNKYIEKRIGNSRLIRPTRTDIIEIEFKIP